MDYGSFSTLTPDDLDAIVAYLRTVPPVSNKVPPPSRPFLPVYLWGKFKMLILGGDPPMVFFAGNAGTKGAPVMKKFLKWALLIAAGRRRLRLRRVSLLHPAVLHHAAGGLRQGDGRRGAGVTDIADPAERAIAERGRYIVMTTGCIGCHATNGSQGPDLTKYLAGGALKIPDAARHLRQPQSHARQGDRPRTPHRR